jgi:hypothetical protein
MAVLSELSVGSQVTFYSLLVLIGLFSCLLLWAQTGTARGKPFENPDGTKDDWQEQKLFFGMAWADILVACPASFAGIVLVLAAPRWGFFLMGMVAFWFLWVNLVTTITSLRFETPKITLQWLVVFPFGSVLGLAYLVWAVVHFDSFVGP